MSEPEPTGHVRVPRRRDAREWVTGSAADAFRPFLTLEP